MLVYVLVCITLCPSFAIILTMKSELVALPLLSFGCLLTVNILWLFLTVPWVGLQFVIVVFPDHTHLLFYIDLFYKQCRKPVPTATQEKNLRVTFDIDQKLRLSISNCVKRANRTVGLIKITLYVSPVAR